MTGKKFIEIPCLTYDNASQELTGKMPDECLLIEVGRWINIERIESYRSAIPFSDFREDNQIWTEVVMESGDSFIVNMPMSDFKKYIGH